MFRFAWCKWLHFICRSLTATSSPQRSLVFQHFASTVLGLSGDSTKDLSAKVINNNCQSFSVFGKKMCFIVSMWSLIYTITDFSGVFFYYVRDLTRFWCMWVIMHCGLMVSVHDHGSSGQCSTSRQGHCFLFFEKTLNSHFTPPSCIFSHIYFLKGHLPSSAPRTVSVQFCPHYCLNVLICRVQIYLSQKVSC